MHVSGQHPRLLTPSMSQLCYTTTVVSDCEANPEWLIRITGRIPGGLGVTERGEGRGEKRTPAAPTRPLMQDSMCATPLCRDLTEKMEQIQKKQRRSRKSLHPKKKRQEKP